MLRLAHGRGGHPEPIADPTIREETGDGPPMYGVDDSGVAWMRPQANSPNKRKHYIKAVGHQNLLQRRTWKGNGAVPRGTRKILAPGSSSTRSTNRKSTATSFGQRGGNTGSKPRDDESQESQNEESGSGSEADN